MKTQLGRVALSVLIMTVGVVFLPGRAMAAGATYTVDGAHTADDPAGTCDLNNVCTSLRAAITVADADPGSTVQLDAGTYTLTALNADNGGPLNVNSTGSITIVGAGSDQTTISQQVRATSTDNSYGVMKVIAPSFALTGVTISGGNGIGSTGADAPAVGTTSGGDGGSATGGGLHLDTGTATLTDVVIKGNSVTGGNGGAGGNQFPANGGAAGFGAGAGIFNVAGTLSLHSSTVTLNDANGGEGNTAYFPSGGGGASGAGIGSFTPVVLDHSTVSDNTATGGQGGAPGSFTGPGGGVSGAGIAAQDDLTIMDSTISGNVGHGGPPGPGPANAGGVASGGGIFVRGSQPAGRGHVEILRSTISGNVVQPGDSPVAEVIVPASAGAGIYITGAPSTVIVNSTISGNQATNNGSDGPSSGGGMYITSTDGVSEPVTIASSTIDGNTADAGSGGNLVAVSSSNQSYAIEDTIIAEGGSSAPNNCVLGSNIAVSGDYNDEDSSPTQCKFAASHDHVGVNPLLQPLANNGGPTQTMAFSTALDPLVQTGGNCTDPANSGAPLTTDQRGHTRHFFCDIGAYELDATYPLPTVTIDSVHIRRSRHKASFTFSSSSPSAVFKCNLDGNPFVDCTSPKSYRRLLAGPHTFEVEAIDSGGVSSPASKRFRI